jgi:DNA replicative helicase MCM subunit Mcm2 (Cdc46/Mcm family)
MTLKSITTIEPSDIQAIEFECSECHSKMTVPTKTFAQPPITCSSCQKNQWFIPGSEDFMDIVRIGQILKRLTVAEKRQFVMRFDISSPSASDRV